MIAPTLYFDLASPYAYLAVARAASGLGLTPALEPILLGAMFQWRGHGSWAHTPTRAAHMAEIEARARRYGLPAIVWPGEWPGNSLAAMRAAVWASELGRVDAFAQAVYRAQFVEGRSLSEAGLLAACAEAAGLPSDELTVAIARPEIKLRLREATAAAWAAGVRGVPTLAVGGALFYGDDQLEHAAAQWRGGD